MFELEPGSAVRGAPRVVRSVWNGRREAAELLIVSNRTEDVRADVEAV